MLLLDFVLINGYIKGGDDNIYLQSFTDNFNKEICRASNGKINSQNCVWKHLFSEMWLGVLR
jgi:hypothetical protein